MLRARIAALLLSAPLAVSIAQAAPRTPAAPPAGLIPAPKELAGGLRWQILTLRPRGAMTCFDLSRDGKLAAFADDVMVRVCDTNGFTLKTVLAGHRSLVRGVAWSADGRLIATASDDRTARIWKADGTPVATLAGHEDAVTGVAWSRDGKQLATVGRDGTLRLWDADGKPGKTIRGGEAPLLCVAFNPDASRVVVGDDDRVLRIWKTDGTLVAKCEGHHGGIVTVDWSPDGKLIASGCEGIVPRDGQEVGVSALRLWNSAGKLVRSIDAHRSAIDSLRFSPDGTRIATVSGDFTIKTWSLEGEVVATRYGDKGGLLRWTPDGEKLFVASSDRIIPYDSASGDQSAQGRNPEALDEQSRKTGVLLDKTYRFEKVQWNPTKPGFAAMALDGRLRFFDDAGRAVHTVQTEINRRFRPDLSWRPDGKELLVTGMSNRLPVFDETGKTLRQIEIQQGAAFATWSPDGKSILAVSGNLPTLVSATGETLKTFPGHRGMIEGYAWSPDGKRFATGSTDSTLRIWITNGGDSKVVQGFSGDVDSLAWSPDGKWIASGMDDGTWRLWNPDGGEGPTQSGHTASVMAIAFSPDGKHVATGGWDGTVRFWNAAGGDALGMAEDHRGPVMSLAWSPDGKRLISASRDNTLRIWNAETRQNEAIVLTLTDGTTATFSTSGELIDGKRDSLDKDMRYIIEHPTAAAELLTESQFRARANGK